MAFIGAAYKSKNDLPTISDFSQIQSNWTMPVFDPSIGQNREYTATARQLAVLFESLRTVDTVDEDTTMTVFQRALLVDASDGPVTIDMPLSSASTNLFFSVKKIDATANVVTINELIDGDANKTITTQYNDWTIFSNGTQYWSD